LVINISDLDEHQYFFMSPDEKELTVTEASNLCGVGRSTISYWIRKKKIHAKRHGKKYLIPAKELLLLLQSRGKDLPHELKPEDIHEPIFKKCAALLGVLERDCPWARMQALCRLRQ